MFAFRFGESLQKKASTFLTIQNQYFSGEKTAADITEYATQPFWQSIYLSKKRLQEKALISETTIESNTNRFDIESDKSTSQREIHNFTKPVKERKKIYANNQLIYNKKDDKILSVSTLKAKGDEENACCPNCGSMNKISSYIDGCDYCGSKFTVNDFSEKISAFSFTENTPKKVLKVFKNIALVLGILAAVFGILSVVSIIVAIIVTMTGASQALETGSLVVFMVASELAPLFWQVFIYTGIIFIVILILAFKLLGKRINKAETVASIIEDFSEEDYAQNLEFKLRNIHFASNAKEVNVYSTFDLGKVIEKYQDVIECTLSKLTFKGIRTQDDMYYIDTDLICSLTKYAGKKIKLESEKISLTMSAPTSLQTQSLSSIHCYYCPNCASSINLLNGGVCDHCGTKLDYSKYSWMIEKYESKGKVTNPFTKIKALLFAIYFAIFVAVSAVVIFANYDTLFFLAHYEECEDFCYDTYNSVNTLDEVVPEANFYEDEFSSTILTEYFSVEDSDLSATDVAKAYCEYLKDEGFSLKEKSDNYRMYYRVVSNPDLRLEGHFDIEIWFDDEDGEVKVEYSIDDSPYEE